MSDTPNRAGPEQTRPAAIQVICLGSGGGPSEDNVSGFLVRSAASGWVRGSMLAMDAGSHMAAITKILERHLPAVSRDLSRADSGGATLVERPAISPPRSPLHSSPPSSPQLLAPQPLEPTVLSDGPFAGVALPHKSARANAAHIVRNQVATYLISHPHLDHLAGFAINTAAFHATSRPKTLAALPFTVDAIKRHIFNDVIWPNLTDEDGGVGFVTFQRLKEGGDIMVGEGEGRGYIEVCEGLGVKGFKVSHGKCMHVHTEDTGHRGSTGSITDTPNNFSTTPRHSAHHPLDRHHRLGTPVLSASVTHTSAPFQHDPNVQAVDSTAYFIRDIATNREVLMFGDVEPDSLSVAPRLGRVWGEAAAKVAAGILTGVFIECSYPDEQADAILFGHLAPRHLVAELQNLADMVRDEKMQRAAEKAARKRKRAGHSALGHLDEYGDKRRTRSLAGPEAMMQYRRSSAPDDLTPPTPSPLGQTSAGLMPDVDMVQAAEDNNRTRNLHLDVTNGPEGGLAPETQGTRPTFNSEPALKGLKVVIMHVKDTMRDGPHVSELILEQLNEHAAILAQKGQDLGCEFIMAESGNDYWF